MKLLFFFMKVVLMKLYFTVHHCSSRTNDASVCTMVCATAGCRAWIMARASAQLAQCAAGEAVCMKTIQGIARILIFRQVAGAVQRVCSMGTKSAMTAFSQHLSGPTRTSSKRPAPILANAAIGLFGLTSQTCLQVLSCGCCCVAVCCVVCVFVLANGKNQSYRAKLTTKQRLRVTLSNPRSGPRSPPLGWWGPPRRRFPNASSARKRQNHEPLCKLTLRPNAFTMPVTHVSALEFPIVL